MKPRNIKPVENNKEKQQTYAKQLGKYKLAVRNEFYFEAMMIVYAMLEDRLLSFLYYTGARDDRNTIKVSRTTSAYIKAIMAEGKKDKDKIIFKMGTITGKMKIINAMLLWAEKCEHVNEEYPLLLKSLLESIDIGGMKDTMKALGSWLDYRNEIIHASMNKNIENMYEQLGEKVIEGMEYARFIDEQVRVMKKDNRVRKKMKMGNC